MDPVTLTVIASVLVAGFTTVILVVHHLDRGRRQDVAEIRSDIAAERTSREAGFAEIRADQATERTAREQGLKEVMAAVDNLAYAFVVFATKIGGSEIGLEALAMTKGGAEAAGNKPGAGRS